MKNEEKRWAVGMLYFGIVFGLVGGLFITMIDRHLSRFGLPYEVSVVVVFLILLFLIDRRFKNLLKDK